MSNLKRVLVAEDNAVLAEVIRFNLIRSGFDVTLSRTGTNAFEMLRSKQFDILVTDYEMPGIDGEELCRLVRNDLKQSQIRIIMCSAKGLELDRTALIENLGIESILFKPFSIRDLTTRLENPPLPALLPFESSSVVTSNS